jgi:hypothetical protein
MRSGIARLCVAAVTLLAIACLAGCQQETQTVSPQITNQDQNDPASTKQTNLAGGGDVYVYNINNPGAEGIEDVDGDDQPDAADSATPWVDAEGKKIGPTRSGYNLVAVTNIGTGATSPSATGSAVSNASAGQNPSQNTTAAPVQDVKPEFTTAIPIAFGMPGSAVDSNANAAGSGGQLSNPTNTTTQTPQWTYIKVPTDQAANVLGWLQQLSGIVASGGTPVVTSQPAP